MPPWPSILQCLLKHCLKKKQIFLWSDTHVTDESWSTAWYRPHRITSTAGHPHCSHASGSVAGSAICVASRGRRHELLLLWGPSFLHRVNMSHLSSWVEPHWWSLTCRTVLHWIATSGMFLGSGLHWIATRTCLGSSSAARVGRQISALMRGSVGSSAFPSTPGVLKVGAFRVVLALVRRWVAVVGTVIRCSCGSRGFAGRAGLQTRMRTAAWWPWRQT